jgi:hypothetical protein
MDYLVGIDLGSSRCRPGRSPGIIL